MSTLSTHTAASSPTWSDVLDSVCRSLDVAIAATDERARLLQPASTGAATPLMGSPQWQQRMSSIDHHLAAAQAAVAKADACCSAVQGELDTQAAEIQHWHTVSRNSLRRLANVAPRSV